jgi:hypothetical protein
MTNLYEKAPSTISINTVGFRSAPIIYKDDSLPSSGSFIFSTFEDYQKQIEVLVLMGENLMSYDNNTIGSYIFKIAPAKKAVPKIELQFTLNKNLDLFITAIDKSTKRSENLVGINIFSLPNPPIRDPKYVIKKISNPESVDFSDIFEDLFSSVGQETTIFNDRKHGDLKLDIIAPVNLSNLEAKLGVSKEIEYDRQVICTLCDGTGVRPGTPEPSKCTRCNGQGEIKKKVQTFLGTIMQASTCPDCKGRGLNHFLFCQDCDGTGTNLIKDRNRFIIPPESRNGSFIRYIGLGNITQDKKSYGNFYIYLNLVD